MKNAIIGGLPALATICGQLECPNIHAKMMFKLRWAFDEYAKLKTNEAAFDLMKIDDELIDLDMQLCFQGFITTDESWAFETERSYLLHKYGFAVHEENCKCIPCSRLREERKNDKV